MLFVNDGSRDRSAALLKDQFLVRPDVTRVILFNANCGQHMAIMAGFEYCRGERVVTLDADLQNPPEEIGKLLVAMDRGHDYVGSIRAKREDSLWRHVASRLMNRVRERITKIRMTDQVVCCEPTAATSSRRSCPPAGEYLHSGAGLHLRRQSDRGHGGPPSAPLASRNIRCTG